MWKYITHVHKCVLQHKYKQKGRRELSSGVFHQMAETSQTEFAKQISDLQSEVRACLHYIASAFVTFPVFIDLFYIY